MHVHLAENAEKAREVGERRGENVLLMVDSDGMHRNGIVFYERGFGVWLVDHVPSQYLEIV